MSDLNTANAQSQESNLATVGSTIYFLQPDELQSGSVKNLGYLSSYYIRQRPSAAEVERMIDALTTITDNGQEIVEVTEPWTIWIDKETGLKYVINGNTRFEALVLILNDSKKKGSRILPIPYRLFLSEGKPSTEDLLRYQVITNDTTTSHGILQLSAIVSAYKAEREEFYLTEEGGKLNRKQAGAKSTQDTIRLFPKFDEAYLSRLRKINNAPAWVKELIESKVLAPNAFVKLYTFHEKQNGSEEGFSETLKKVRMYTLAADVIYISEKIAQEWINEQRKLTAAPATPPATASTDTPPSTPPVKEEKSYSKAEVIKMIEDTNTGILTFPTDAELGAEKMDKGAKLVENMLKSLSFMASRLEITDVAELLPKVSELFLTMMSDSSKVYTQAESESVQLYNLYGKIQKSLNALNKPASAPTSANGDVQTASQDAVGEIETVSDAVTPENGQEPVADASSPKSDEFTVETESFVATVS